MSYAPKAHSQPGLAASWGGAQTQGEERQTASSLSPAKSETQFD